MRSEIYIHGLMLLMVLLVSSSFPVGAEISGKLPAEVLMFVRFFLASLIFLPFVLLRYTSICPTPKLLLRYAILSLPLVGFFWCMFEALQYTTALNTGALYTTVPAITAVYAWLVNKYKVKRAQALGLCLGSLGAIWIVFRGDINALVSVEVNRGDWIFFCGCLCMGLYNPLVQKLYIKQPVMLMTFWVTLSGSFWLLLISLSSLQHIVWAEVPYPVWGWVFYLALFTTLVTFFLVQLGTVNIGAVKVASYSFLTPIGVLLLGMFMGTEEGALYLLPGIGLVILAMLMVQVSARKMVS